MTEGVQTRCDVVSGQSLKLFRTECFTGETGQNTASNDGPGDFSEGRCVGLSCGNDSGKTTGECIASACWIDQLWQGKCATCEELAIRPKQQGTMLTLFYDDILGAKFKQPVSGGDEVVRPSELTCLILIDDEEVEALHQGDEVISGDINPEVHAVCDDKLGSLDLIQDLHLGGGRHICQQDDAGLAVLIVEHGFKVFDNVQGYIERFPGVHVRGVFAGPAECFASLPDLDSRGVDVVLFEHLHVFLGEVIADDSDQIDWGVEGCSDGGIRSGPAQDLVPRGLLSFDGIDCDGASD